MKNKTFLLLKILLLEQFGFNRVRCSKDPKEKRKAILFSILMSFVVLVMIAYVTGASFLYAKIGLLEQLLPLLLMVTSLIILFTTIFKTNGVLFGFKDYDMVVSLPVSMRQVLASRFLTMYLLDLLFALAIMVPGGVVYAVFAHPSVLFYVLYVLAIPFIPLIPIVVATAVGAVIMAISSRFRRKNIIAIILSIAALCVIMVLTMQSKNLNQEVFTQLSSVLTQVIYHSYPVAMLYAQGICEGNIVSFLLFLIIGAGLFTIFLAVVAHWYSALNTALTTHSAKHNYKLQALETSSQLKALYHKEMRRYFSSNLYVMNTAIGGILLLLASVAVCVMGAERLASYLEFPGADDLVAAFAPLLCAGISCMCCTTSSALSLEGKNFWIVLSAPVDPKAIMNSKVLVNFTVIVPPVLLSAIFLTIGLRPNLLIGILLFATPLAYVLFTSYLGLWFNKKFPNFNWSSEVAVIKQSAPTLLTMLVDFALAFLPIIPVVAYPSAAGLIILGITVVVGLLALMLRQAVNRTDLCALTE